MSTRKIESSLVTIFLLSQAGGLLNPLPSLAQSCSGTLQSTTYSTTLNGTGNAAYAVTWPQYSPPGGYTLVSAVMKSVVTMTASFQITNNNAGDVVNVRPGVTGEDVLQVNGSNLYDADGNDISTVSFLKNLANIPVIHAGETYNAPTAAVYTNFKMMTDSIATDNIMLNDFIGNGNLNVTYSNTPGYAINATVQVTPAYSITNKISLTYYYCYTGTLAADILTFTAARQSDGTVALKWASGNEQPGRKYVIQVSSGNGNEFRDAGVQLSELNGGTASYSAAYPVAPGEKGRLYFRIKVIDAQGAATYSPLRIIDLSANVATSGFMIYPNPPVDYFNIGFPFSGQGWQVDVISAMGVMVQRSYFNKVGSGKVSFTRRLSPGTYFVRATEQETKESRSATFTVQ
jgi:hypothetical protein